MNILGQISERISMDEDQRTFFGQKIASGEFSVIFKVDYPFVPHKIKEKFNAPVLVITQDKGKMEILQSLINSNFYKPNYEELREEALNDWLSENGYSSEEEAEEDCEYFCWDDYASEFDLHPFLNLIEDETDLEIFFMEKGEEVYFERNVFTEMESLFRNMIFRGNYDGNAYFFRETLESFKFEKDYVKELKETLRDEYLSFINLFKIIKRDMIKACNTKALSDAYLTLDLHDGQFIDIDDKIYLSDAFVY